MGLSNKQLRLYYSTEFIFLGMKCSELHHVSPQHIYNIHMATTYSIKEWGPSTFSCLTRVRPSIKEELDHIFVTFHYSHMYRGEINSDVKGSVPVLF